jgi:hypothetical protein
MLEVGALPARTSALPARWRGSRRAASHQAGALHPILGPGQLRLQDNLFTGRLPATAEWSDMTLYRAALNRFSGEIPLALYRIPFMDVLALHNNRWAAGGSSAAAQ